MSGDETRSPIASLALVGKVWGELRRLPAFDKKRHTVPDRVSGATQAFLEKLCEPELEEEAESLFQSARQHFGYKRREISLDVGSGYARLESKDFVLELRYELDEEDASTYAVETSLALRASRDFVESDAFSAAIGPRFDRLRCGLRGGFSVESVIDAVEDDGGGELAVHYPSDCATCTVTIEGVDAEVFVDGSALEVRFGKQSTAAALVAAFEGIGRRFRATAGMEWFLWQ